MINNKLTSKVTSSSELVNFIYHNYSYLLLFGIGKLQSCQSANCQSASFEISTSLQ